MLNTLAESQTAAHNLIATLRCNHAEGTARVNCKFRFIIEDTGVLIETVDGSPLGKVECFTWFDALKLARYASMMQADKKYDLRRFRN